MSTKTILKKIAVVAVAALAIGGVSAVSANAATTPTPTLTVMTPSTAQQGATITLTGTDFRPTGETYVTFQHRGNNNNNTIYVGSNTVVASSTSLTTVVPAGILAGQTRVRVVTNDGINGDSVASGYLTLNVQLRAGIAACNVTSGVWEIDPALGYDAPVLGNATDGLTGGDNCTIVSPVYATVAQSASAVLVLNAAHNAPAYADLTTYVVSAAGANKILGISGSISGVADFTLQADGSYVLTSSDDVISGDQIGLSTANLGSTTVTWSKRVYSSAFSYTDTAVQKFIINVSNQTTTYVGTIVNGNAGDPTSTTKFVNLGSTEADASGAIFAPKGSSGTFTPAAAFYVHQLGSTGGLLGNSSTKAITVTLSGVGSVQIGDALNNPITPAGGSVAYSAWPAASGNSKAVYLWSDGRSGVSTLTFSVNGVVVATKTLNFYGAVASLTPTPNLNIIRKGGVATSGVSAVTAKDASGTVVPLATGSVAISATGSIVAAVSTTSNSGAVTGSFESWVNITTTPLSASGDKTTLTASYALPDGTFVTSGSWVVTLGGSVASVTAAFDAASYALGAPFVLTLTGKDSSGNAPAEDVLSGITLNGSANQATANLNGIVMNDSFTAGKYTIKGFAPVNTGTGTFSVAISDGGSITASASAALEANAGVAAAQDAAAEATDAANAATDAANAAAEAADAATAAAQDAADAVAALAAQVSTMISALKKQLIALTNLVIKIQKKVKA